MEIKKLIEQLQKIVDDNEPHKDVTGEATIQIDIFEHSHAHLFTYRGFHPDVRISVSEDGVYNILSRFPTEPRKDRVAMALTNLFKPAPGYLMPDAEIRTEAEFHAKHIRDGSPAPSEMLALKVLQLLDRCQWNRVEDSLPQEERSVILILQNKGMGDDAKYNPIHHFGFYGKHLYGYGWCDDKYQPFVEGYVVTHWRYPDLPEELIEHNQPKENKP